jgi:hypothetical protein
MLRSSKMPCVKSCNLKTGFLQVWQRNKTTFTTRYERKRQYGVARYATTGLSDL